MNLRYYDQLRVGHGIRIVTALKRRETTILVQKNHPKVYQQREKKKKGAFGTILINIQVVKKTF